MLMSIYLVVRFMSSHQLFSSTIAATIPGPTDISDAWKAIVNCDSFLNGENSDNRIWTLPDGTKWMGNITHFYNRPCYDDIIQSFSRLKNVLVKGTPGTGKTLFLQRVLVQILHDARIIEKFPSIHYMRYLNGVKQVLSFCEDGSVSDITNNRREINAGSEYLLSDCIDLSSPYGTVLNLEVASDLGSYYNKFRKRIQESRGRETTMPLFSFEELLCIKPDNMEVDLAQLRYDIYGGSARNFMNISDINGEPIPIVELEMRRFYGESIAMSYPRAWQNIINDVSSLLQTKNDRSKLFNLFHSMMQHRLPGYESVWASLFMQMLAAAIINTHDISKYTEVKEFICNSHLGNIFKLIGHRKLLNSEKKHILKPLLNIIPNAKPVFPLSLEFNIPVTMLKKISDISSLDEAHYGLPVSSYFSLFDAIIQPDTIICFTVNPTTHERATERIEEIREQLHAERHLHRMIFIVPLSSKETFLYQKNLGNILQFICFDDPVDSEDILMSKAEAEKWMKCHSKGNSKKRK